MDNNTSTDTILDNLIKRRTAILDKLKNSREEIITLSREIDELEDKAPDRPKSTPEEYDKKIQREQFAFDHEDAGGTKLQYDQHLRKLKHLNQEKKAIDFYQQHLQTINKKKNQKRNCNSEVAEMKRALLEINDNISKFEAQKRISHITKTDINVKDICMEEVSVTPNSLPMIIGKEKANLHSLETELSVYIAISPKPKSSLLVYGTKSNIAIARDVIEDITVTTTEQIDIPQDLIRVLLGDKGNNIRIIQNATRTKLNIVQDPPQITAIGGRKALQKVRDMVGELLQTKIVFPLNSSLCSRLVSPGDEKSTRPVQTLRELTGAELIVDFEKQTLTVYGFKLNKEEIKTIINKWIADNKTIELVIPLDDNQIKSYFLENKCEKLKVLRDESKVYYNFSNDPTNPSVILKGTEDDVAKGKSLLMEEIENYKKCNISVATHSAAINVLRNNNSAKLKEIESKANCSIYIDRDTLKVFFSGTNPETALAGKKEFDLLLADFTLDRIEFDPYLLPLIIGKEGSSINKIKIESQAFIDIESKSEEASITLSGLTEQVSKAEHLVKEFLHNNELGKIYIDTAILFPSIIGPAGSTIKRLQETHHVNIDAGMMKHKIKEKKSRRKMSFESDESSSPSEKVITEKHENETLVVVRGLQENVTAALEEINSLVTKYSKENANIIVQPEITSACSFLHRSNLDQIQTDTHTQITYNFKFHRFSISGDEENVQKVKKMIETAIEGKCLVSMPISKALKGIVIGKGGSKLKEFQTTYNITISTTKNDDFTLWGKEEDCLKAKTGIDTYIKNTVKIEKLIPIQQSNIYPFLLDSFELVKRIEEETGAYLQLPRKEEMQLSRNLHIAINGNYHQVEKCAEYVNDVINNRVRSKFSLPSEHINKLESGDFNVDHVRKETSCRIEFNKTDNQCIIIGTDSSVAKAKSKILNMLIFYFPESYFSYRVSDTELSFLSYDKRRLDEFSQQTGAKLDLDEINHNIWCLGKTDSVQKVKEKIVDFIQDIRKTNYVIYADPAALPMIIGKKGAKISKLREDSGAQITIGNNSEIFINGTEEAVTKARELIETLTTETSKLNNMITNVPYQVLLTLLTNRGSNIKKIENDTGTYITIDKEEMTINIRGATEEQSIKAKDIIENTIKEYNATKNERDKEKEKTESRKKETKEKETSIPSAPVVQSPIPPVKHTIPGLTFEDASKFYPPKASKSMKRKIKKQMSNIEDTPTNPSLQDLLTNIPSNTPYIKPSHEADKDEAATLLGLSSTNQSSSDNNYYKSTVGGYTVRL